MFQFSRFVYHYQIFKRPTLIFSRTYKVSLPLAFLSTQKNENTNRSSTARSIPEPTWSIEDICLDQKHDPISQVEIEVLAKRALILLDDMQPQQQLQLRQDLGNMMHMINKVSEFSCLAMDSLTDADIYDIPRGVTEAPVRQSSKPTEDDEEEAKQVWESYLEPKTKKLGAHIYFEIATRQETVSVANDTEKGT